MPGRGVIAVFVLAAAAAACDEPIGHPPIARIDLTPAAIPAHDQYQTAVTLDGSASADPIDDPAATRRLTYQWDITDDDVMFDMGKDTSKAPVVRFRGLRPAVITLTVTDEDGNASSATKDLQLTVK